MKKLTDREAKLYARCCEYGQKARFWRNKFIGLLPQVATCELYKKLGFSSIFEFAAKLAGVSHDQVRLVLHLEERYRDKPHLHQALTQGKVSLPKLARVVTVATPESEAELVGHLKVLSQPAIETLVRDIKGVSSGLRSQALFLSEAVTVKLLELQNKGLDVNELLLELLARREQDIEVKKIEIGEVCEKTRSRYIPMVVRKVVRAEYGNRCSIRGCARPSEDLHHTQRFALAQRHDPRYLAPLCKNHHQIAHAIDARAQQHRSEALRCGSLPSTLTP